MTVEELKAKIEKKQADIAKKEKNLSKYANDESPEFIAICDRLFSAEERDYSEIKAYKAKHNILFLGDYYSKRYDLEDAKATLAKYQKQLIIIQDKENTLLELPEELIIFKNNLITRWDKFDQWKKEESKKEYLKYQEQDISAAERHRLMSNKYGKNYRDLWYMTNKQIHNSNVKDAENLVLNLLNRTIELCGKITDTKYLELNQDNQGYLIINGIVIGEKGKARVESIGAGGYNIQRYHIRVLVKEIK